MNSEEAQIRYSVVDMLSLIGAFAIALWWAFYNIIPHDAGLLADMALRVLQGQLPHLHFDDTYTGLLNWLHAGAFKLFGIRITSLRICLLIFVLPWLIVLQWAFRRICPPLMAGLLLLLSVVWSLPTYSESMPSWYNVFLATWGVAALWKHSETGHSRWLIAAGCCGGVSALFKISGIFFLPATALYVIGNLARERLERSGRTSIPSRAGSWIARSFILSLIGGIGLIPLILIRSQLSPENAYLFLTPIFAWAICLLILEWRAPLAESISRLRAIIRQGGYLAIGAAVPIVLFALLFATIEGGLPALYDGVFVLPFKRVQLASFALPKLYTNLFALPLVAAVACGCLSRSTSDRKWPAWLLPAFLILVLIGPLFLPQSDLLAISACRSFVPALCVIASLYLVKPNSSTGDSIANKRLTAMMPVLIFTSLIQYPYTLHMYFLYFFPLVVLGTFTLLSAVIPWKQFELGGLIRSPSFLSVLLLFLFPVLWMNGNPMGFAPGSSFVRPRMEAFDTPRGDSAMLVPPVLILAYFPLIETLQKKAGKGARIYAQPDCPEVAFLAEMTPVSRAIFPCLGNEPFPPAADALLAELREKRAELVVIHLTPAFSPKFPRETIDYLKQEYPEETRIRKNFIILSKK